MESNWTARAKKRYASKSHASDRGSSWGMEENDVFPMRGLSTIDFLPIWPEMLDCLRPPWILTSYEFCISIPGTSIRGHTTACGGKLGQDTPAPKAVLESTQTETGVSKRYVCSKADSKFKGHDHFRISLGWARCVNKNLLGHFQGA